MSPIVLQTPPDGSRSRAEVHPLEVLDASDRKSLRRRRYLQAVLERRERRAAADAPHDVGRALQRLSTVSGALRPGLRVLDLGCGLGDWSLSLARKGFDCHAIDRNPDFVRVGQDLARRDGVEVRFAAGLAEQLPYLDSSFDLLVANFVLEHVVHWRHTLLEAARVLKPSGMLFVSTANILCPFQDEVRFFPFFPYLPGRVKRMFLRSIVDKCPALVNHSLTPAQNWFTPSGLRRYLRGIGFSACHDLIDVITQDQVPKRYPIAGRLLPWFKRWPPSARNLLYILTPSIALYAVRNPQ